VDDGVGLEARDEIEDALSIADVEFVVVEVFDQLGQAFLIPTCVALRTEENGALVIVDAMDFPSEIGEVETNLRADEAGRTGNEEFFHESRELGAWSLELERVKEKAAIRRRLV
jgi:Ni,Fe-hydrogenase maturation factor